MYPDHERRLASWQEPVQGILRFVADNFGVQPDFWQEDALKALAAPGRDMQRVALQACVGPGKTAVLAWFAWWFLGTQGDKDHPPKGLATAITSDNLKQNLWAELSHWQQQSAYLRRNFEWTSSAVFLKEPGYEATWRIEARSWPKTASPEQQGQTFSGLHAKYVCAIIDESGNIPTPVLRAAEQALVRCAFGKIVQAGNPTALQGFMLCDAATILRHQWHVIKVTGDPADPNAWVNSPRVLATNPEAKAWAELQLKTYGRDNAWTRTQILGQFPESAINNLLSLEDIETSVARKPERAQYDYIQKRLGIDVARFGDDRSVFSPRQGVMIYQMQVMRGARTDALAARGVHLWSTWGDSDALVLIDDTGHWGHGVIDQMMLANVPVIPLVYHAKATHPRFKNRKAEMWVKMTDAIKAGARLPNDVELHQELMAVTYTFQQGQFVIEEKDQVKARIGRSPDKGDALAETYALDDVPKGFGHGGGRARTADDPGGRDSPRRRAGRALTQDDVEGE